jgi:hypothetical protein
MKRMVAVFVLFVSAGLAHGQRQVCNLISPAKQAQFKALGIPASTAMTEFMTAIELVNAQTTAFNCEFPPARAIQDLDNAIAWRVTKFAKAQGPTYARMLVEYAVSGGEEVLSADVAVKWLKHNSLIGKFNAWDAADVRRNEKAHAEQAAAAAREARERDVKAREAAAAEAVAEKTWHEREYQEGTLTVDRTSTSNDGLARVIMAHAQQGGTMGRDEFLVCVTKVSTCHPLKGHAQFKLDVLADDDPEAYKATEISFSIGSILDILPGCPIGGCSSGPAVTVSGGKSWRLSSTDGYAIYLKYANIEKR